MNVVIIESIDVAIADDAFYLVIVVDQPFHLIVIDQPIYPALVVIIAVENGKPNHNIA